MIDGARGARPFLVMPSRSRRTTQFATHMVALAGCAVGLLAGCGREVMLDGPASSDSGPGTPSGAESGSASDSAIASEGGGVDAEGMDAGWPGVLGEDGAVVTEEDGGEAGLGVVQCRMVTSTLCTRSAQCITGTNESTCESQLNLEFDCDLAGSQDFSACLQDDQAASCDDLLPEGGLTVPTACLPPITAVPLSDAQQRCYDLVDAVCAQSLECAGWPPTSGDVQNCEDDVTTDLQDGLPCLLASAVGAGYAQCVASIPSLACPDGGAPGDGGLEAGSGGMPLTAIPACANALVFSP